MQFLESAEDLDVEPRQIGQEGPLSLAQSSICAQETSDITQVVSQHTLDQKNLVAATPVASRIERIVVESH